MKHFGFHKEHLLFKMRNPTKVKYLSHKDYGNFEIPNNRTTTNVRELAGQFKEREEWEKYMNPLGIKQTITSRFKKPTKT